LIAEKPKNKSPEVAYTLSGFSVYYLFSGPGVGVIALVEKVAGFL